MTKTTEPIAEEVGGRELHFPETRSDVLAAAAGGEWGRFFDEYLGPCWRELTILCRHRGIRLAEADDLFQELCLRIIRPARSRVADVPTGNLPARFLAGRAAGIRGAGNRSAQFRTFLKKTLLNILRESLRAKRRRHDSLDAIDKELESLVDRSVAFRCDDAWIERSLSEAAGRFRENCRRARTRARQRGFEILYETIVERRSPCEISRRLGLERSTVAGLLSTARHDFLAVLKDITGIDNASDLKHLVHRNPQFLVQAFFQNQSGDKGDGQIRRSQTY